MPVFSKAGIRRLAFWEPDASPGEIINLSNRGAATLTITEKDSVRDYKNRVKPHMINFKVEAKDFSIGRPLLYYLLRRAGDSRVSAEVVTRATALSPSAVYDGVYQFIDESNALGIDFDYIIDGAERSAAITLEKSFDWLAGKTIIDAALTVNPATLSGFDVDHYDGSMYRSPKFEFAKYGASDTVLFDSQEIISRKLSLKTNSTKNIYDTSTVHYIDVSFEVELSKAGKSDIKSFFEITDCPKLILRETDPNGLYEEHVFNAGVLSIRRDSIIGDENRTTKLYFEGKVPVAQIVRSIPVTGANQYTYSL